MTIVCVHGWKNERDINEKKFLSPTSFQKFSGRKHTIRRGESVKMLDADWGVGWLKRSFSGTKKRSFLRKNSDWSLAATQGLICREVTKTRPKRQVKSDSAENLSAERS